MYHLSFGMYFLYAWCTRECCNRIGRTPICRDSMVNRMFCNTFPMRDYCIIHLSLRDQGKVYDLSFGRYFLYTWCTKECCNRLGRTPICRELLVNHMFRNAFPMRDYCIIHLSLGDKVKFYDLRFSMYFLYTWCTIECCNRLVVLQSAEILGLIICFAKEFPIHDN